jgi:hypothetical protein
VLLGDDVRGAIRRYGGHARRRAPLFCPAPPAGADVQPSADGYTVSARFTLPQSPFIGGYITRVQRGSCAAKPGRLGVPNFARPGQTVTADVTPPGDPFSAAGDYCLSVWSQGDFNRAGSRALHVHFRWAPQPVPAPASLSGQQSQYAVTLAWPAVQHAQLAGFKVDFASGTTCPATPGTQATLVGPSATGATVYPEGRGPTCFAVWSVDARGHLSTAPETVVLDLAGTQPPTAAFTPDAAYGTVGDASATVQFSDASADPDGHVVAWSWDFGDGATSSASSPAHTYTQAGDYSVTLTVTDDDGLTSQAYGSVSIS